MENWENFTINNKYLYICGSIKNRGEEGLNIRFFSNMKIELQKKIVLGNIPVISRWIKDCGAKLFYCYNSIQFMVSIFCQKKNTSSTIKKRSSQTTTTTIIIIFLNHQHLITHPLTQKQTHPIKKKLKKANTEALLRAKHNKICKKKKNNIISGNCWCYACMFHVTRENNKQKW